VKSTVKFILEEGVCISLSVVSEIMSPNAVITISIESDPSVLEVAKLMAINGVGSIVLTERGRLRGIITERDILKKISAQNKEVQKVAARDIMSSPLLTIKAIDSIDTAAETMVKNKVKRLVVIEQDGSMKGILIMTDIVKKLAKILTDDYSRYRSLRGKLNL